MFSARLPPRLTRNRLASECLRLRAEGTQVIDLTVTNPTMVGLVPGPDALTPLGSARGRLYRPDPWGLPHAREVLAAHIGASRGRAADAARLALTASTSEAYSMLFKLLCDAGDEVLVPQPSYPLFDHLAAFDLVRPMPFQLEPHGHWSVDRGSIDASWSDRTRAVIVVSPNNPTGSYLRRDDLDWLIDRCARRAAALIVDEVFAAFPLEAGSDAVRHVLAAGDPPALVFALDGLSKRCGLPQLKLAWMEIDGPAPLVENARSRLELILDTYLSVNTPVQEALPALLAIGEDVAGQIRQRLRHNLESALEIAAREPGCTLLPVEGGWSAVLRVPAVAGEEALVLDLLTRDRVLVHPGYYFDFPCEAFLVVSLLPEPAVFAEGLSRVVRRCGMT